MEMDYNSIETPEIDELSGSAKEIGEPDDAYEPPSRSCLLTDQPRRFAERRRSPTEAD